MSSDQVLLARIFLTISWIYLGLSYWLIPILLRKFYLREIPGLVILRDGLGGPRIFRHGCWYFKPLHLIYRVPTHTIALEITVHDMITSDTILFSGRMVAYLRIRDQDQNIQDAARALANYESLEVTPNSIMEELGDRLRTVIRLSVATSTGIQLMQNSKTLTLRSSVAEELRYFGIDLETFVIQSLRIRVI